MEASCFYIKDKNIEQRGVAVRNSRMPLHQIVKAVRAYGAGILCDKVSLTHLTLQAYESRASVIHPDAPFFALIRAAYIIFQI